MTRTNTFLIARREVLSRLDSRPFLISMAVLLALVFGGTLLSGLLADRPILGNVGTVATTPQTAGIVAPLGIDTIATPSVQEATALVEHGDAAAAVLEDTANPLGYRLVAMERVPAALVQMLAVAPPVDLLNPEAGLPVPAQIIGIAFGIVFMWSGVTFGTTIAQSVVEEKQTRIIEILLSTVSARALLAGKVIGNSLLAFGAVAVAVLLGLLAMGITGQDLLLEGMVGPVVWFVILFAAGFMLLATVYAALASTVSRQEDIGAVTSPAMLLVTAPYMLVIMFADDPQVLRVMSYVPFSAPVGMPMRIYQGLAAPWEPFAALAIVIVSLIAISALSARVYTSAVLQTAGRVRLRQAVKSA